MSKFSSKIMGEFREFTDTIAEIREFTLDLGLAADRIDRKSGLLEYAVNIAGLSAEAIDHIQSSLEDGHIFLSMVLSRWYIEYAHLIFLIYENQDHFQTWLSGKRISHSKMESFLGKRSYSTWGKQYNLLSQFVHPNPSTISSSSLLYRCVPENQVQLANVAGNMMTVAVCAGKVNNVLLKVLCDVNVRNASVFIERYNLHEKKILALDELLSELLG